MALSVLGDFNHLHLVRHDGQIAGIRDRGRRKPVVTFEQLGLDDLATPTRLADSLSIRGPMFEGETDLSFPSRRLSAAGDGAIIRSAGDFGLGIVCQPVVTEDESWALLLRFELPPLARLRLGWQSLDRSQNRFVLAHGITITLDAPDIWLYRDNVFSATTAGVEAQVSFLIDSDAPNIRISSTTVLFEHGAEREALLARAALGRGFVSIHETTRPKPDETAETSHDLLHVRLDPQRRSSAAYRKDLGLSARAITIVGPNKPTLYGPMLLLAVANDAELTLELTDAIVMRDAEGSVVSAWSPEELLGVVRRDLCATSADADVDDEIVVCENAVEHALVAQAVGYADLRAAPIVFVPAIASHDATSAAKLRVAATNAVPPSVRERPERHITAFTCGTPLHLVEEVSGGRLWQDGHIVSHLPKEAASRLVPRHYRMLNAGATDATFTVVFDALAANLTTEGRGVTESFDESLAHGILLSGHDARHDVLREFCERLETDLLLIAAHADDESLQDGAGHRVPADEIAAWRFQSSPVALVNACSSWSATGEAFIRAGARAVISTLWPVTNTYAARLALAIGHAIHVADAPDPAVLLHDALSTVPAVGARKQDRLAYFYVGVPGDALLARRSEDVEEGAAAIANTYRTIYDRLYDVAEQGLADVAMLMHRSATQALRARFHGLVRPGEMAVHLPPPLAMYSVLEGDLLVAQANVAFGRQLTRVVPIERRDEILEFIEVNLIEALKELEEWNIRHEHHLGHSAAARTETPWSQGAISETSLYQSFVYTTIYEILPFVALLGEAREGEHAEFWFRRAKKLVAIREDLASDGSVTDDALIGRLRAGVKHRRRVFSLGQILAPNGGEIVEFDAVSEVATTSDIANRFGVACNRMDQVERAERFFAAASEIAAPESLDLENARSNLTTARRRLGRASGVADLQASLDRQVLLGDPRNAVVTAANLLRAAAQSKTTLDEGIIDRALGWAEAQSVPTERFGSRADVLAAAMCYWSSLGGVDRANAMHTALLRDLTTSSWSPRVSVALNDPVKWHQERGMHHTAANLAIRDAGALAAVGLLNAAARTYLTAGAALLAAYRRHASRNTLLQVLDCFEQGARIIGTNRHAWRDIHKAIECAAQTTNDLWRQAAALSDLALARCAYSVALIWDDGLRNPAWDAIVSAFDTRNAEEIADLCRRRLMEREATVTIDEKGRMNITVTTIRNIGGASPFVVYSYLPLYNRSQNVNVEPTGFADAGVAAFPLEPGAAASVIETGVSGLRTDGRDAFLYEEAWGSAVMAYRVTLRLADCYVVQRCECDPSLDAMIVYDDNGCLLTFSARDNESWASRVRVEFVRDSEEAVFFRGSSSPFRQPTPALLYSAMFRLVARGGE